MAKKKVQHDDTKFMQSKTDALFTNVKDEKGKVRICVGKYLVSMKEFDTFKQADEYLSTKPYEIMFNLAAIVCQARKDHENNQEKSAENK